jgi:putative oxidoreductase
MTDAANMAPAGVQRSSEASPSRGHAGAAALDAALAPYGLFVLRLAIGIDWLVHAFLKTSRGMHTHEALLARNGITPLLAWPTFSLEVVGGLCIVLGIYSRQWAAFLLIFLGVVVWIKWPVGWVYSSTGGGWEYPFFWLMAQLAFVLLGDGAFAIRSAALIPNRR